MTKAELVETIATETGVSKSHTGIIVQELFQVVSQALTEGKHLEIRGFGTFKVRAAAAR